MVAWAAALSKTRALVRQVFSPSAGDRTELNMEELEEMLLRSDMSVDLAMEIAGQLDAAPRRASRKELLRDLLLHKLDACGPYDWSAAVSPRIILLLGVNGSGKTTTAAKLARMVMQQGLQPLLCGSDTFRAAGSSQLRLWSERLGCDFVGGETGQDAAGVAYNAVDAALDRKLDVVLVDTAGRMHTKTPLMDELPKMCRAVNKRLEGAPHEVWMVLDASLGQNAVMQARQFNDKVPLTGIIITKLDGSSRAGFLFSIRPELKVPVLFAGLGEGEDDLVPFDPGAFVDALFENEIQNGK